MSAEHEDDRELSAKIDALPREVAPDRDLWTGVQARIATKPGRARRRPELRPWMMTTLALTAPLAAAAVWLLMPTWHRGPIAQPATPGIASVAPAPAVSAPTPEAPKAVVPEEDSYRRALAVLTPTYLERKAQLPEADAAKVEASLRALERARAATTSALAEHPDDPDLRAELDAEYEQEIQTMNDVLDWTTRS